MTYSIEMFDGLTGLWISASPRTFARRAAAVTISAKIAARFDCQCRVV